MADISIKIAHNFTQPVAKQRAENALSRLAKTYGIRGIWTGGTFTVTAPAKGTFVVGERAVEVTLDLGILLRSIKTKIEAGIREEISRAME